jgi:hypothetical protein
MVGRENSLHAAVKESSVRHVDQGYQREPSFGACSFDGRVISIVRVSDLGLVDVLHRYSNEGLGQRKMGLGFGFGVLLRFRDVGYIKVSREKHWDGRRAMHTRSHVDCSEHGVPVGENGCDCCKSQYW